MKVQKVTIENIQALQEISRFTFSETFSSTNTEEDMKKYLDESFSIEKITAELNNTNSEFYFAKKEEKIIGYLKLNFGDSQTELKDNKALEIERIYVLKEFHGQQVGQILYEKAIQRGIQKNVHYVWLGVWEKNLRAIHFYKKNGFIEFDKHIFNLGNDKQIDIMMKLEINKNSI